MPIGAETIRRIGNLAAHATPGPRGFAVSEPEESFRVGKRPFWKVGTRTGGIAIVVGGNETDAAFISACDPQTIIGLLDELTKLRRLTRAALLGGDD